MESKRVKFLNVVVLLKFILVNSKLQLTQADSNLQEFNQNPVSNIKSDDRKGKSVDQANLNVDYFTSTNVPGTNLSMHSINYFKIGVKRYHVYGFVTWTNEEVSCGAGNYLQLSLDPNNKSEYEKGGEWYEHIHWFFQLTEVEGFVTLRLRTFPNAFVAVVFDPKTDTNHLVLLGDHILKDFSAGGPKRCSALFQLIPSDVPGHYRIKVKAYPKASITYTDIMYGRYSYYLEVDDDDGNIRKYEKGQEWEDDALFFFEPIQ